MNATVALYVLEHEGAGDGEVVGVVGACVAQELHRKLPQAIVARQKPLTDALAPNGSAAPTE